MGSYLHKTCNITLSARVRVYVCMLCERVDCESCAVNEDQRGLYHAFVLLLSILLTVFLLSLSVVDGRGQLSIKQSAALVHAYNLSMLLSEARVLRPCG